VLSEFIARIFPGGSVSSDENVKGKVSLLGLGFDFGIEWFDRFAIRAPVASVSILLAGNNEDGSGLVCYKLIECLLKFVERNRDAHMI
jgi:hypothetical protein